MKKILLLLLFTAVILLFAVKNTTQILAAADWPSWFITYTGDVHGEDGITSARPALASQTTCDITNYPAFFSNVSDYVSSGLITHNGSYDDGCVADDNESETMDLPLRYGYGGLDIDQSKQRYNYDYFFDLISDKESLDLGERIPHNPDGFYIYASNSIDYDIDVKDNDKAVIFVSGDLTFEEHAKAKVHKKGFLAFIVGGKIKFDPKIDKDIAGVYIANTIRTGTKNPINAGTGKRPSELYHCNDPAYHSNDYKDKTFEAEGIFIAWENFYLERDLEPKCKGLSGNLERRGDKNIREPGEVFYYMPNLLVFAPEEIKLKKLYWEEIAP